ncbi:hypothetical protein VIBHAR_02390 [Vibrio campbellii ATCC BAA-1116]|uniref:Uncharacterized protein n=1 Tax=Vibrio campbellii (strain ATCC BAA-1116) TaxID=2902295 RepID=A7MW47_VIBC1|nr:hypothetical protein VIBHAR_02390 [Vibrio campbellii ATCC BAA-1116]
MQVTNVSLGQTVCGVAQHQALMNQVLAVLGLMHG